ncbi:MAG: sugar phosphate nucleotidyltransferase [Chloroflexota bacterium]
MDTMKIVLPMAGFGTRMRPHTWSKPKPLVSVAGKPSLEHLMDLLKALQGSENNEYIFIVSPNLGESQIPAFVKENFPNIKANFVVQREMKGQSHAIWLAREHLQGPLFISFSDTLIESDFSFLEKDQSDGIVWVMPVPDPRRFGVVQIREGRWIERFIEKPSTFENNLAVVGYYYLKSSESLLYAIEQQMKKKAMLKGEYFLADAISIMIENGAKIRIHQARNWLDTGTIEATLATNRFMLERLHVETLERETVKILPPVFIHDSAEISNSTIGPYASIGAGCVIRDSKIEDSILEPGVEVDAAALTHSLIGKQAKVQGRGADGPAAELNVGDNSTVKL